MTEIMARPRYLPNDDNGSSGLIEILKTVAFYVVLQGPLLLPGVIAVYQKFTNIQSASDTMDDKTMANLIKEKMQHQNEAEKLKKIHEDLLESLRKQHEEAEKLKKKHEDLLESLRKQHEEQIQSLKKEHHQDMKQISKMILKAHQSRYHNRIKTLLEEEFEKEQSKLASLEAIEPAIQNVLDLHCSPTQLRKKRMSAEQELIQNSPKMFHEGLQNIFLHDHRHCGGGFYGNGQLWRIWFQLWKTQTEAQKYKNVIDRIQTEDF